MQRIEITHTTRYSYAEPARVLPNKIGTLDFLDSLNSPWKMGSWRSHITSEQGIRS
jgi:hypothetical protein